MQTRQKRFQYWTKDGTAWADWYDFDGTEEPVQIKSKGGTTLYNEYRTIERPDAVDTADEPVQKPKARRKKK